METCFFTLILMIFSEQIITIIFFNILNLNSQHILNIKIFKFIANILIILNNILLITVHCTLWKYIKNKILFVKNSYIIKNFFIMVITFMIII
ncbi:accessory regulator AgrC, partial [Clostridium botulinum]|nr:accessory regulator AgrC [Clostridium botulinum]